MKNKVRNSVFLFVSIFLLTIVWSMYLLNATFLVRSDAPAPYKIPLNAELTVQLNGEYVAKDVLLDVLFNEKGDELMEHVRSLSGKKTSSKQYGINWMKPAAYFKGEFKGKPLQGMLVHVLDVNHWNASINTFFGSTSVAKSSDGYGMVVQSDSLSASDLYAFIEQQKIKKTTKMKVVAQKSLLSVAQKTPFGKMEAVVDVKDNAIVSTGIINHKTSTSGQQLKFLLAPSDFHLSSDLITKELSDTIQKTIGINRVEGVELSGLSLNYRGVTVAEVENKYVPFPDADFILTFSKNLSLSQFIESFADAKWNQSNETVLIGSTTYFIKQLDDKTIYFGRNETPEIRNNNQSIGIKVLGNTKYLTNIKGSPFIRTALRMSSNFSLFFELAEEITMLDIQLTALSSTSMQLNAKIEFKTQKNAALTLLEMIVKRQI
jgi:hypothetical protein